jgi:hypothetical protein
MNYYHTDEGQLPSIEKVDYNGYKFDEVIGEDRFTQKRKALTDYRKKLRQQILDCKDALKNAGEDMDFDEDMIW